MTAWTGRKASRLEEEDAVILLARLDRLGLIELLPRKPDDRPRALRFRMAQRRTRADVLTCCTPSGMREFLHDAFEGRDALLRMDVKELGDASIALLAKRLEQLAGEFNECAELDASLPAERRRSVGMVLALRPWVFFLLDSLRAEQSSEPRQS